MPLKENEKNVNYKARLEKKLYLARENPEPIFDLSDCNLKTVPNNIFSLCRVFRKKALYLQNNKLSSLTSGGSLADLNLLTLLDLSSNNFKQLPDDINFLENLQILNVSQNQLKELPERIGDLKCLLHINASNNHLKHLPGTIGGCVKLEYLNVKGNQDLKSLPTSLCKLQYLKELQIGSEIVYPLPEICKHGVQAILTFLAQESNEKYEGVSQFGEVQSIQKNVSLTDSYNTLQQRVMMLEKMKEQKQKELLSLEEQLMDENRREFEMHQYIKDKKKDLVITLKKQQETLDTEIKKIQENREFQRALLIKECNDVEEKVNKKIEQIIVDLNTFRARLAKTSEKERKEEEEMLTALRLNKAVLLDPADKAALLTSMNDILKEEIKRIEGQSGDKRAKFMEALITEDQKYFEKLYEVMRKSEKHQSELIERIAEDERLQRTAVSSLVQRNDAQLWQIRNQISSVETQLFILTQVELTRKKLEADSNLAELLQSRQALTEMLMELFMQQSQRRKELIESLRRLEDAKNSETFWLEMYDKLLHSKSQQLAERLRKIDPDLANEFFSLGIFHYLPVLSDVLSSDSDLEALTPSKLSEFGVDPEDEFNVMKAVRNYLRNKAVMPSAPPEIAASAPNMPSSSKPRESFEHNEECVICMDAKCDVVFVPCGHICCCNECSKSISQCPLCRSTINHIFRVIPRSVHSSMV